MPSAGDCFGVLSLKGKAGQVLRWLSEGKTVEQVAALCGDNVRDRVLIDTYTNLFDDLGLIERVTPVSSTFQITDIGRDAIKIFEGQDARQAQNSNPAKRRKGRTFLS